MAKRPKTKPFYIIVTRYDKPGKRPITHAYGAYDGWSKNRADVEKRKLLRDFREEHPKDSQYLTVSVLKLVDIDFLNANIRRVESDTRNPRKELI